LLSVFDGIAGHYSKGQMDLILSEAMKIMALTLAGTINLMNEKMRYFKRPTGESSGNKWFKARPHPGPLPRGEGGPVAASGQKVGAGTKPVHGFKGQLMGFWLESKINSTEIARNQFKAFPARPWPVAPPSVVGLIARSWVADQGMCLSFCIRHSSFISVVIMAAVASAGNCTLFVKFPYVSR
jgi:hypothetical protein